MMAGQLKLALIGLAVVLVLGALTVYKMRSPSSAFPDVAALSAEETNTVYAAPLAAPKGALSVFHLGHSLVGRDMPAMLQQLSPAGHRYDSQLGWGTPLADHWAGKSAINGFKVENDHPRYRDAKTALGSGEYDAVVLTEMVEIEAAIAYFDSPAYLARWAAEARAGRSDVRIYLYESWHDLNDPLGWLERLDGDLETYWDGMLIRGALARDPNRYPIYLIPVGQVFAALTRAIEAGQVPGLTSREDLFARTESGKLDTIHANDIGHYLVALTHYAVLYQTSPEGLPHLLRRADGSKMDQISQQTAQFMQQTVWNVVTRFKKTGIAP